MDNSLFPRAEMNETLFPEPEPKAERGPTIAECKAEFDRARQEYPGRKRGLDEEWSNFQKKHKATYREEVWDLFPAIKLIERYNANLKARREFVSPWKNFATWINGRWWTEAENL